MTDKLLQEMEPDDLAGDLLPESGLACTGSAEKVTVTVLSLGGGVLLGPVDMLRSSRLTDVIELTRTASPDIVGSKDMQLSLDGYVAESEAALGNLEFDVDGNGNAALKLTAVCGRFHVSWDSSVTIVDPSIGPFGALCSVRSPVVDELDVDTCIAACLDAAEPKKHMVMSENQLRSLCDAAQHVFDSQPILLELESPINILGNIHGQYVDLLALLHAGGFPPEKNYLGLGNYVSRGKRSLEVLLLLLSFKVKYPENVFLLRGSQECASISRIYGFYDECKRRYNIKTWKFVCNLFNHLPVAAVVGESIFCCHGGISPELFNSLDPIRKIVRPIDVPDTGVLCDLLWADPDKDITDWHEADAGISYRFGANPVKAFLAGCKLDLVCRAHQVVEDGYEFYFDRSLVSIFSASNYCGEFENSAAMMVVDEALVCSFKILRPSELVKQEYESH